MQELLTMSQKERKRIKVLDQKTEGKLTVKEASGIMGISERQTYRLLNRY
ncbi:MAG: helix-turn-helix domain-containing protein, partial [Ignavibacterium sp.]